jgi:hypothetical protein
MPGIVAKLVNGGTATAPSFPAMPTTIPTGDLPGAQAFGDFNCDGLVDLAVSTNGCSTLSDQCPGGNDEPPVVWMYLNNGSGYDLVSTTSIPLGGTSLAVADLDRDGYLDLVASANGSAVTVLRNTP